MNKKSNQIDERRPSGTIPSLSSDEFSGVDHTMRLAFFTKFFGFVETRDADGEAVDFTEFSSVFGLMRIGFGFGFFF